MISRKSRIAFAAVIIAIAGVALGAVGFDRLKDNVKIGQGTATTKTLEFDIGLGTSNPKITVDSVGTIAIAASAGGGLTPVGSLVAFAGSSTPTGWLLCDGSAVSRTTYSALFTAISTTYGVGNGTTTFNLPDLRGRSVAGKDNMGGSTASRITNALSGITGTTLGAAGGAESITPTGTIGGSQSIAHTHGIAHVHYAFFNVSGAMYVKQTASSAFTTWNAASGTKMYDFVSASEKGAAANFPWTSVADGDAYTGGVIAPPTGSAGSTAASAAMSANATVSGSNFSYTGATANVTQPTIILNYLIKI